MAQAVIGNPQGQLLINSLDSNNDSPIQLAAYRGHNDLFLTLAQNNAFLDQPNAAGEDAIDAIQNPKDKERILIELSKQPNISQSNRNRIQAENKKQSSLPNTIPLAQPTSSRPNMDLAPLTLNSPNSQQKEGHMMFESVMNDQKSYIMNSPQRQASPSPSRKPNNFSLSPIPILSATTSANGGSEFDLMKPMEEFYENDEIAVVSLVPANGFFFPPKSTAFDRMST
jgi:hypothetical protein